MKTVAFLVAALASASVREDHKDKCKICSKSTKKDVRREIHRSAVTKADAAVETPKKDHVCFDALHKACFMMT